MQLFIELFVVLLLMVANGVFAMAEIAVVSSRKARLKQFVDEGRPGAAAALALAERPDQFLSVVQIGITLVGVFAGAFGGARFSGRVSHLLVDIPFVNRYAEEVAIFIVVSAITFLSLVIGELVPKRVALANPEGRAMLVAKPMTGLARLASPFVWVLTISSNLLLKLMGLGKQVEAPPSDEEISNLVEQGTAAGVFHKAEREMVEGVLGLDERPVTAIMTRRNQIIWLNAADPDQRNWDKMITSGHSHFPVFEGTRDNVIGIVSVKALWAKTAGGLKPSLRDHLTAPLLVPDTINGTELLEVFKKSRHHLALVTDEFGSVQGLVSLIDVIEAIVGDLPEPGDALQPTALQREDGSWLVDGGFAIGDLRRRLKLPPLPGQDDGNYETLGGFIIDRLGYIPKAGAKIVWEEWRFEVVDMDRHRVDKVLISTESRP